MCFSITFPSINNQLAWEIIRCLQCSDKCIFWTNSLLRKTFRSGLVARKLEKLLESCLNVVECIAGNQCHLPSVMACSL